jgi:FkbM family methyltransferase
MRAVTDRRGPWILRSLLSPVYRLPCTVVARTGLHYRLRDDMVDDAILRHLHAQPAVYFPDLAQFDDEGVMVLDVGAHHGFYTLEALRRYPGCRVVAVEPDPDACRTMRLNIAINKFDDRVRIVSAGLSGSRGAGLLSRGSGGSWATRVQRVNDAATNGHRSVTIRTMTLSDVLDGEVPAIVKCNAEGAEFSLVPQMIELGIRPALIVLMTHPAFGSAASLVEQLQRADYLVRDVDDPPAGHRFHCVPR